MILIGDTSFPDADEVCSIRCSGMFLLEQRGDEGRIFIDLPSLEDLSATYLLAQGVEVRSCRCPTQLKDDGD